MEEPTNDSPKRARSRGIYLLPNLFTTASLFAGFYAIVQATSGEFSAAAVALFIGGFLDSMDGRVARMTKTTSEFGKQYDSLADCITFGTATALIALVWGLMELGKIGWLVAFLFAAATALRLARFNTQDNNDKRYFQGMPCPAAALTLVANIWLMHDLGLTGAFNAQIWIWLLTLATAAAQVSNLRYRSFKDINVRERIPFTLLLLMVVIMVLISLNPPLVTSMVGLSYLFSGPILSIIGVRQLRARKEKARNK